MIVLIMINEASCGTESGNSWGIEKEEVHRLMEVREEENWAEVLQLKQQRNAGRRSNQETTDLLNFILVVLLWYIVHYHDNVHIQKCTYILYLHVSTKQYHIQYRYCFLYSKIPMLHFISLDVSHMYCNYYCLLNTSYV